LIGLGLSLHLLQVNQFRDSRMNEDMMAPTYAGQPKAKSLDHIYYVSESNVPQLPLGESFEQSSAFHQNVPSSERLFPKLSDSLSCKKKDRHSRPHFCEGKLQRESREENEETGFLFSQE